MNDHTLKISVITPSFNSGHSIERAIKSVLVQDYHTWEHVVIDGGSTDGTLEILKKYDHLDWISEPDAGQADAMNKGFHRCTGDIIVYLNADDYFFPSAFSAVMKEFEQGAMFVVGNVFVKSIRTKSEFLNNPRITLEGMLRHWEPNAFCHNPLGYFYRRNVQSACPFNTENHATMDLEFLLEAASRFPFTKIGHTLGCFEDNITTKTGTTQARLDYWMPETFPYLDKYLSALPDEERGTYEDDRRSSYASLQMYMNDLNRDSFKHIPPDDLPLISVIIPTYNCSPWLRRSIDSVLSQGLTHLEIIVIDDASTDDTQDLLSKHYGNNPLVHILLNEKNMKLGASRNRGITAACGKYIFFLDADDWLEPGALGHLASIAEEYHAEIVACGVKKVWGDGRTEPYHAHAFAVSGGREALYHLADYRIGSIAWNKLYLRAFIIGHNLSFVAEYFHEDVLFSTRAAYLCGKYISIADTYCNYFQRSGSIVNARPTPLHLKSYFKLYADMLEFIKGTNICNDPQGETLCRRLFKAHCSNEIYPKLMHYIETHTKEEWEKDCCEACSEVFGINGYAVGDFLLRFGLESYSLKAFSMSLRRLRVWRERLHLRYLFDWVAPKTGMRRKMIRYLIKQLGLDKMIHMFYNKLL